MSLMDGWDYEITGDGLDWVVSWDAPLGLRLEATVSFSEVEYTPPETEHGEAWGAPYKHTHDAVVECHNPVMSEVRVVGDAHGALHLSQALKAVVIAKVREHVKAEVLDDKESEREYLRRGDLW